MLPFPPCLKPWIATLSDVSLPNSAQGFEPRAAHATTLNPTQVPSADSPETPQPKWKWLLFLQDLEPFQAEPSPSLPATNLPATSLPALVLWLSNQKDVWISFPLGHDPQSHSLGPQTPSASAQEPTGRGSDEKDRSVIHGLCHEQATWWPRLDELDSCPQASLEVWQTERDELRDALLRSHYLSVDGMRWILIPCHDWSLMAQVLASHSPPPPSILLDWMAQWNRASLPNLAAARPQSEPVPNGQRLPGSPIHTLVSKSGLICSLETFLMALIDALQLDPQPAHSLAWIDSQQLRGAVATWPRLSNTRPEVDPLLDFSDEAHALVPTKATPVATPTPASTNDGDNRLRTANSRQVRAKPAPGMQSKKSLHKRSTKSNRKWNSWVWLAAALALLLTGFWLWPKSTSPPPKPDPLAKTPAEPPTATKAKLPSPSAPSSSRESSVADANWNLESTPSETKDEQDLTRSDGLERIETGSPGSSPEVAIPTVARMLENMESQIKTMRRAAVDSTDTKAIEPPQASATEFENPTLSADMVSTDSIVEQTLSQSLGSPPLDPKNVPPIPPTPGQNPVPVDEPSRQFAVDPLELRNPTGEPGDVAIAVVDPASIDAPDPSLSLDQEFPVRRALSRSDVKVGRSASLQHSAVVATLELTDEAISEILIVPEQSVRLDGPGTIEWRIALEDSQTELNEPELIVRLTSKPGPKWQFATQVGVQFEPIQPPILLGPEDSRAIVRNLGVYEQWLRQSIDTLSNSPFPPKAPNAPNTVSQLRMLRAQLKECEKALDRWKRVQRLSNELFGYGSIQLRLEPQPGPAKAPSTTPNP
jgi:hypothetical protein